MGPDLSPAIGAGNAIVASRTARGNAAVQNSGHVLGLNKNLSGKQFAGATSDAVGAQGAAGAAAGASEGSGLLGAAKILGMF
jgi:hypothetical protein